MDILLLVLRIIATVAGLTLMYAAFFLYPREREGLKNRLEEWWIRADDLKNAATRAEPVFVRESAKSVQHGFEWAFGNPFSKKFFIVTGLLSMIAFMLAMGVVADYGWAVPTALLVFAVATLVFVMQFGRFTDNMDAQFRRYHEESNVSLAKLRSGARSQSLFESPLGQFAVSQLPYTTAKKPWWEDAADTVSSQIWMIVLTASPAAFVLAGARERGVGPWVFFLAITTTFVSNAVSIFVTMSLLERVADAKRTVIAAAWLLLDAAIAAAMVLIPFGLFWMIQNRQGAIGNYLAFVSSSNISAAAPSAVYILAAVGLLLHRVLWPLILRPFYNLIHAEKLTKPKTLGAAGLVCCLAAWPQIFSPLKPILDKVQELF